MHCGELTAVIGPNGAGKTTLLKAILGEMPHSGELQFLPFARAGSRAPRIGYVPQKLEFDTLSPISVLDLFAGALSRWPLWLGTRRPLRETVRTALRNVDAEGLMRARLGRLSGGEHQRVLLALALTPVPDILLLDEPVSGVDQAGVALFYQTLSRLRRTHDLAILLISHDMAAVGRVADRIVCLNRTIVADGPPALVLADSLVRTTMGLDVSVKGLPSTVSPPTLHEAGPRGTTP